MSRPTRWPLWVLITLIALPVLEVIALVAVGKTIGWVPTLLALLVIAVLGGWLVRREGPRTWRSLRSSVAGEQMVDGVRVSATNRPPLATGEQLSDGAIVLIGAILLLLPGFLTDVLAIICLLPFTRRWPRRLFSEFVRNRARRVMNTARGPVITQVDGGPQQRSQNRTQQGSTGDGPVTPTKILPPGGN